MYGRDLPLQDLVWCSVFRVWVHTRLTSESVPDFRTIRAGDLNLLTQVGFEETLQVNLAEPWGKRAVFQPKVVVGMRKVYRARVFGTPDPMTAVVYEGSLFDKAAFFLTPYTVIMKLSSSGGRKQSRGSGRGENDLHPLFLS